MNAFCNLYNFIYIYIYLYIYIYNDTVCLVFDMMSYLSCRLLSAKANRLDILALGFKIINKKAFHDRTTLQK